MSAITLRDAALLSNQVNYQSLIESSNNTHLDSYDDYRKVTVRGGGVLPYMGYIGMCRCVGYGFQVVYSRIGYINQSVWVWDRVLFFRKLISWLKISSRLGKQLL